jgi:hypothetical protein
MGGPGSGVSYYHWWRPAKKTTVEKCLAIDAGRWGREGILRQGVNNWGSWRWTYPSGATFSVNYEALLVDEHRPRVRLSYSWRWGDGPSQSEDYHVGLEATRPRFGGLRWWFHCPLVVNGRHCGRRVGKLHLPPHGRYFGCRRCHRLTYTSCQESRKDDRLLRILGERTGSDPRTVKQLLKQIGKPERPAGRRRRSPEP